MLCFPLRQVINRYFSIVVPLYLLLLTGISKLKLGFIPTLILVQLHKRSQCVQGKLLHYWVQLVVPLCRKKQSLFALHYRRNDREALQSIRPSTMQAKRGANFTFSQFGPESLHCYSRCHKYQTQVTLLVCRDHWQFNNTWSALGKKCPNKYKKLRQDSMIIGITYFEWEKLVKV